MPHSADRTLRRAVVAAAFLAAAGACARTRLTLSEPDQPRACADSTHYPSALRIVSAVPWADPALRAAAAGAEVAPAQGRGGAELRGHVEDAATRRGLGGAVIWVAGVGTEYADSTGAFRVRLPASGRVRLRARAMSHAPLDATLDALPATTYTLQVALACRVAYELP